MGDPAAVAAAGNDVEHIAVAKVRPGEVDLFEWQINFLDDFDWDIAVDLVAIFEETSPVDALGERKRMLAADFAGDVLDEPGVAGIPVGLGVVIAGGDADLA